MKAANRLELTSSEAETAPVTAGPKALAQSDVGVVKKWLTNNDYTGRYALTNFTLKAVETYGEVWVANDLNYPAGDPRNSMVTITDGQVQYLLNEFEMY